MPVLAFDCETWLIEPGLLAPPLVCLQWQCEGRGDAQLLHREDALEYIEAWLDGHALLVGHNVAYDMGVIAAQWPHLLPRIFAKYDRDQVTDTLLREQLTMITRGTFRSYLGPDGEPQAVKYSLADCVRRHFGRQLQKDGWRLFYRVFDEVPDIARDWQLASLAFQHNVAIGNVPEWARVVPQKDFDALLGSASDAAITYALDDARTTLQLYQSQESYYASPDQFRQARAAFALHLSSAWGMYTDTDAVDKLEAELTAEFEALRFELQQAGLIREDGTADTKAAMAMMTNACAEESLPIYATKGGKVSLSAEACGRFTDDEGEPLADVGEHGQIVGKYSRFLTLRKTLTNDIKMLRAGAGEAPVQPRYDLADTGRTRCSKPNIQAINRGGGIREAFRPRPGKVFIQADFEGLELHTLAAWCLEKIGWSKLAESLNAGRDVHADMASDMLGITSEEGMRRKKAGDKDFKEARQRAKAINFGLPGGLGAPNLVRYAKKEYSVTMTPEDAVAAKATWLRKFPEMHDFFRLAAAATNNPSGLGTEEHIFTGRLRGNVRYSALCNGRFQGLGADAAKEALWRVTKACYVEPESPLYGCRVVAFVHDEIIAECDEDRAALAANSLGALMCEGANVYLSRVPVRTAPQIMRCWSKSAEPVFDEKGQLIPWEPKTAAA